MPGGATTPVGGAVTVRVCGPVWVKASSRVRVSLSLTCCCDGVRIATTCLIAAGSSTLIVKVEPQATACGAWVILGRGP